MIRGTTPTFILTINDEVDLTQANNVYATFKQGNVIITKTGEDITLSAKTVEVYLTQAETLSFANSKSVEVQLNWTYSDGSRACTNIITVTVARNLLESVLE